MPVSFSDVPKFVRSGDNEIKPSALDPGAYEFVIRDGHQLGQSELYSFQLVAMDEVMSSTGETTYTDAETMTCNASRGASIMRALTWAHGMGEQLLKVVMTVSVNEKGRKSIALS